MSLHRQEVRLYIEDEQNSFTETTKKQRFVWHQKRITFYVYLIKLYLQ